MENVVWIEDAIENRCRAGGSGSHPGRLDLHGTSLFIRSVLGLISMVVALLGVAVLVTYSPQNGLILLVIAFLIVPSGCRN